ncbi:MAG: hypothetical protein ACYCZZ_03250 [Minisyncoccota bacterium]
MNKKNFLITVRIFVIVLAFVGAFFWFSKSAHSPNREQWATYTQRLDSGDVITIDYPARLIPQAYQISSENKLYISTTTNEHVRDIRFESPEGGPIEYIDVVQGLPESQAEIDANKKSFEIANKDEIRQAHGIHTKPSAWHLGKWTAYEESDPSGNYYYHFVINSRSLNIQLSAFSETDVNHIMSSIRLNGVPISILDSMQGWSWPELKTGGG